MPQAVRQRRQTTLTVSSFSQKQVYQLGKGMIYRELFLRFYGSLTYGAAANNTAATLGRGDEWSAISRIDIIVNGTDIIRSFSGTQLKILNLLWQNSAARPSLTLGDAATAAPTFDSTLIIPFWQPLSTKPLDTALDSSKLGDFRIEVTIAPATDINSANPPTAISASIDVLSLESFGIELQASDCRVYTLQQVVAGANPNLQIQLPTGPLYRGFFLNAANGSVPTSADLPNAITNVQLASGPTVFRDIPFPCLRDWQRQRIGWRRDFTQGPASSPALTNANGMFLRTSKSANIDEDGWVFFDLVQDGYLGEGIDANGLSEIYLNLNVAAACTISVLPVQIWPRRA